MLKTYRVSNCELNEYRRAAMNTRFQNDPTQQPESDPPKPDGVPKEPERPGQPIEDPPPAEPNPYPVIDPPAEPDPDPAPHPPEPIPTFPPPVIF